MNAIYKYTLVGAICLAILAGSFGAGYATRDRLVRNDTERATERAKESVAELEGIIERQKAVLDASQKRIGELTTSLRERETSIRFLRDTIGNLEETETEASRELNRALAINRELRERIATAETQ